MKFICLSLISLGSFIIVNISVLTELTLQKSELSVRVQFMSNLLSIIKLLGR